MNRFVACPRCEGRGTHVNPAVDGNGISREEMDELGDDFLEDYLGGVYDVACEECHGERVVPRCAEPTCYEPAERDQSHCYDHATDDERAAVDERYEYDAMVAAELRMGA